MVDCQQGESGWGSDWSADWASNRAAAEGLIFPASFAQQRLWFIDQLTPGTSSYTSNRSGG